MKNISHYPHIVLAILVALFGVALTMDWSQVAASTNAALNRLGSTNGKVASNPAGGAVKQETAAQLTTQSLLTVTILNDSGAGSLRDTIASASPGDTITFSVTGTITLTTGEIAINKNLIITGPGVANLTISGNNNSRVFFISPGITGAAGPTVSISDLTIANGRARGFDGGGSNQGSGGGGAAGMGGGMFINGGAVTLTRVDFRNNTAVGGNGGATATPNNAQLAGAGGGGMGGSPVAGQYGGPLCAFDFTTCYGSGAGGAGGSLGGNGGAAVFAPINGGTNGHSGGDGAGGGGAAAANVFPPANQSSPGGGTGGFGGGGGAGAGRGSGGAGGFGGGGGAGGSVVGGVGGVSIAFGGRGGRATSFAENPGGGGGAGLGGALFVRTGSLQLSGNNTFANNSTTGGAGGISLAPGINGDDGQAKGGAIFIHNEAAAFLSTPLNFSGNTAANAGTSVTDNINYYGAFNCAAGGLTLSPANLSNGVIGAAYPNSITATGGIAPYSFAVTSGAAPTGLTLNADGTWNGTPLAIGIFNFTVTATNADGCSGSRAYTVTVTGPNEQLSITAANPFTLKQGNPPLNAQIASVSDANQAANTLMVTATPLTGTGVTISGISLDALGKVTANIALSCAATSSTFTLTVTNNQNATKTATLTVNVTANTPPTLGNYANTSLSLGGAATITPDAPLSDNGSVSAMASAANFTGTFVLNQATGVLTVAGAGPVGVFIVQIKVFDNCGASVTRTFTLTVSGTACNSLSFSRLGTYATAVRLSTVLAVGDFNQDGFPDSAVVNQNFPSSGISVQLNNSSGGFVAPLAYSTIGQFPNDLKAADLNGDGFPDLLATFGNRLPMHIYLNNGSGGFGVPQFISGDPFTFMRLATGDFNLDGKLDVAATDAEQTPFGGNRGVAIFLGNGQGGFSGPTILSAGTTPTPIVTGDFNQDGFLDLATMNDQHSVAVLLGTGTGSFGAATIFPTGTDTGFPVGTLNLVMADFNQDGKLDLAASERTNISGQTAGKLSVLLGAGNGSFGAPITMNLDQVESLQAGDFNEDGKPDLFVGVPNATLRVLPGLGDGSFGAPVLLNIASSNATITGAADFNLDGHLDLAVVSFENFPGNDIVAPLLKVCTTAPTINCPGNITMSADAGQCSVVVNFAPTATGTPAPTITCTPASGSVFPKGTTTVNCTAANGIGSDASCSFTVTVSDTQPPTLTCPASIVKSTDVNQCSAVVSYTTPTASDNCTGVGIVTCVPASGSTFQKGVTTVTCSVADAAGNLGSCSFTVTVNDVTLPSFTCPANIVKSTDTNLCTAVATFVTPAATDNCPGVSSVICTPASGFAFPKGVTTVTCAATDTSNNMAQCQFTVTVNDTQNPSITCPANITKATDPNQCTAVVTYATPAASDNCSGIGSVSCTPASGFAFPKGMTTVTCSVSDAALPTPNSATCSFTVTINDTQAPTITCPANLTQSTDANQCQAVVTYTTPTASDNCSGVGTVSCTPPSGSIFQKGTATVTCSVSDGAGNPNSCSFTVTIADTQAPTLNCPANLTKATDANQCSAVVAYTVPTASDNCSGVGAVNCTPASGATFPKGTTTVSCNVMDASGNSSSCSFTVTVNDTQNPALTCPANISKATDANQCTAVVTYTTPAASDNCPNLGSVNCSPVSGTAFPKGVTTVACSVSDASNNQSACSFTVTISDTQAPTLTCPANITRGTDVNLCSAVVTFAASINDNCTGATLSCNPPSGTAFPKGTTTVTCTATDASNNQSTPCSFTVTVNDMTPPNIACPANITKATDANLCSAVVTYATPTATDNCPGVGAVSCLPLSGSAFAKGVTTVTCTVTDASKNQMACSFTVTVNDTQAPTITCPANQIRALNNPTDTSLVVNYPAPVFSDNCPGASVACVPPSGSAFALGTTTVTCTATDTANNKTSCAFTVTIFDVCMQDDSNAAVVLLFNSLTGNYLFCCGGTIYTGTGTVQKLGSTITLTHNTTDRRVTARFEGALYRGTTSLQSPVGVTKCSISDRDVRNNSCVCAASGQ